MTLYNSIRHLLVRRASDTDAVAGRARAMIAAVKQARGLFQPSNFWDDLVAQNLRMIEMGGIENFKRSVAQNYFNWAVEGPSDPQMRTLLAAWAEDPSPMPLAAELHGSAALDGINGLSFLRSTSGVRAYTLFVKPE
jgi:hypothetical protein